MNDFIQRLPSFSLTCIFMIISILSLLPNEVGFQLKEDKIGHLLAYLALTVNSLYFSRSRREYVKILMVVVLYGIFLEYLQSIIPGRQASFLDFIANTTGVILGMATYRLIGTKVKKFLND